MASDVSQDLCVSVRLHNQWTVISIAAHLSLETQLADGLAVASRLLRSTRACKFDLYSVSKLSDKGIAIGIPGMTHIVNTKVIQSLGNLNLLLSVEKGIGELLTLPQSTLDNLESGDVAQEVSDTGVVTVRVPVCGRERVLARSDGGETLLGGDIFAQC